MKNSIIYSKKSIQDITLGIDVCKGVSWPEINCLLKLRLSLDQRSTEYYICFECEWPHNDLLKLAWMHMYRVALAVPVDL